MSPEVIVDSRDALASLFVGRFEASVRDAVAAHGRFACALPGGSVAEAFFPKLVDAAVDWTRVDIFWGDERAVPPTDPESNYGLARRLWLDHVPIDPARVHAIHGENPDLEAAAAAYARELAAALGSRPLDLVLLGMGPEGHVCSLFPGHALLEERTRLAVAIHDSPKPPPRRITLTMPVLTQARLVVVTAEGERKAEAMRAAIDDPASPLPIARVLREAPRVVALLDPPAARLLRQ